MKGHSQVPKVAVGLAILAFVVGLGLAFWWWLVYHNGPWLATVLLVIGLGVALLALAIVRRRASMGWTALFFAAFSLLLISVMSPLGLGPFFGPVALLLLASCLWELFHPA